MAPNKNTMSVPGLIFLGLLITAWIVNGTIWVPVVLVVIIALLYRYWLKMQKVMAASKPKVETETVKLKLKPSQKKHSYARGRKDS